MSEWDEWVRIIHEAMQNAPLPTFNSEPYRMARAALAAVEPLIRRRALEDAAKEIEGAWTVDNDWVGPWKRVFAERIRALATPEPTERGDKP